VFAAAAATALSVVPAPASASEYSEKLARRIDRGIVYVDRQARPRISTAEEGRIRLQIVKKDNGRIRIGVVPEDVAAEEGGSTGLAKAVAEDLEFRGTLMIVSGDERSTDVHTLTTHDEAQRTADAVRAAFAREDDRADQILRAVDAIAAVDPGSAGDIDQGGPGGAPGSPDFGADTDGLFDSISDTFRTIGLIIAASFLIPIVLIVLYVVYRLRRSRQETEADVDFANQGLRNELIALGDEIRGLEVDVGMQGANALGVADYEAAVHQYDRANQALELIDQNPRYAGEVRAALKEGQRRMSDAKVRLGVTPTP
jgi:hypothetical protein